MCSEAVWWRCHRRILTDYLIACGETVFNIMGQGRLEPAHPTPGAVIRCDRTIVYPASNQLKREWAAIQKAQLNAEQARRSKKLQPSQGSGSRIVTGPLRHTLFDHTIFCTIP